MFSIFSLLKIIMLSRALYVAADLNIADHLAIHPMTINELAQRTSSDSKSLERMMHFLELYDVFKQQDDGKYSLTDFSKTMCDNHPSSIKSFLLHDDEARWNSIGHLGYSIATGNASYDMLYKTDYFNSLKQDPLLSSRFNNAMKSISSQEDLVIATKLSFEKIVADIGGGTGNLLNNIINHNGISQGILFDLPETVAQASNLDPLCSPQGGSFFEPLPFTADIFILKRILHDWDDEKALTILKNISNAMHADSKLYIIEGILDYSEDKQLLAAIDLALLTIFKGRERNRSELESLIKAAGLEIVSIKTLDNLVCSIECKKVV